MTETPRSARRPSPIDELCDQFVTDQCAQDAFLATAYGVDHPAGAVTDYSPQGEQDRVETARRFLADVQACEPLDDVDRVTQAAVAERIGLRIELHEAGLTTGELRVIACPGLEIRDVFDIMPKEGADDWAAIAARMSNLRQCVEGYQQALEFALGTGCPPARRQALAVAGQLDHAATDHGAFATLAAAAPAELPGAVRADLQRGLRTARDSAAELSAFLRDQVAPRAREGDAVGREVYALLSRRYIGATIDLEETYSWGIEELQRVEAEMAQIATRITGDGDLRAAAEELDRRPGQVLYDRQEFRDWMQQLADRAVDALDATHFDIDPRVRRIECMLAPNPSGGIYYTPPAEDFSRPGRMWWAVPEEQKSFAKWRETTTVYHEGVPGHHLQFAAAMVRPELNRWRRGDCWVSGHGEGWALYSERLMAELGYLDDDGDRFGMLDASAFRAMRVVGDIGLHCGFTPPGELGTGHWDADALWRWITAHTRQRAETLRFEHLRYLGWPGQAPSYKVGERIWLQIRALLAEREGEAFDLRGFHQRALALGSLGLDLLQETLLQTSTE